MKSFLFMMGIFICYSCSTEDENTGNQKGAVKSEFTNLDSAMIDPQQVKSLIVRNQGWETIPKEIFQMRNIEVLDLSLNEITELPVEISQLNNLIYLSLSYNYLERLPEEIAGLENLTTLKLLDNQMQIIPTAICELQKLETLNLTENSIAELPNCFKELQALKICSIAGGENEISPEQQRKLRNSLPSCNFSF